MENVSPYRGIDVLDSKFADEEEFYRNILLKECHEDQTINHKSEDRSTPKLDQLNSSTSQKALFSVSLENLMQNFDEILTDSSGHFLNQAHTLTNTKNGVSRPACSSLANNGMDRETPRMLTSSPTLSTSSSRSFVVLPHGASKFSACATNSVNGVTPVATSLAEFDTNIPNMDHSFDDRTPMNEINCSGKMSSTDLPTAHETGCSSLLSMDSHEKFAALQRLQKLEDQINSAGVSFGSRRRSQPAIDTKILQEKLQKYFDTVSRANEANVEDKMLSLEERAKSKRPKVLEKLAFYETLDRKNRDTSNGYGQGFQTAIGRAASSLGHPIKFCSYNSDSGRFSRITNPIYLSKDDERKKSFENHSSISTARSTNQNWITSSRSMSGRFHSLNRSANKKPPLSKYYDENLSSDHHYLGYNSDSELGLGDKHLMKNGTGTLKYNMKTVSTLKPPSIRRFDDQTLNHYGYRSSNLGRFTSVSPSSGYSTSSFRRMSIDRTNSNEPFSNASATKNLSSYVPSVPLMERRPLTVNQSTTALKEPCSECDNLRRKLQLSEFKPVVFDVSTKMENCRCDRCVVFRSKTWSSIGIDTANSNFTRHVAVDATDLLTKSQTCEVCVENRKKMFVGFGINTEHTNQCVHFGTNTEILEIASRTTNTPIVSLLSLAVNTEPIGKCDVVCSTDDDDDDDAFSREISKHSGFNGCSSTKVDASTSPVWTFDQLLDDILAMRAQICDTTTRSTTTEQGVQVEIDSRNVRLPTSTCSTNTTSPSNFSVGISTEVKQLSDRSVDCVPITQNASTSFDPSVMQQSPKETSTFVQCLKPNVSIHRSLPDETRDVHLVDDRLKTFGSSSTFSAYNDANLQDVNLASESANYHDELRCLSEGSSLEDESFSNDELGEKLQILSPTRFEINNDNCHRSTKFDFTKPRYTRAFHLSKAAAAKKLLTSTNNNKSQKQSAFKNGNQTNVQDVRGFNRSNIQSKSLRLSGEKFRNFKRQSSSTSTDCSPQLRVKKFATSVQKLRSDKGRRIVRKSLLLEEEEANDIVGPLLSDVFGSRESDRVRMHNRFFENSHPNSNGAITCGTDSIQTCYPLARKIHHEDDAIDEYEEGSYDLSTRKISDTCEVLDSADESQKIYTDIHANDVVETFVFNSNMLNAFKTIANYLSNVDSPHQSNTKHEYEHELLRNEWLKTAAHQNANARHVEQFLDVVETYGHRLLHYVVNSCDQNENTGLHYSVSHCNFDVVSLLLDTKVCNLNKPNKAGYTPVMLAALCPVDNLTDRLVVQRLFHMGDVNVKASQHGQTALMLAVSHGKVETTKLLIDAGAGLNIQDEDGSTALMCASEHGHTEIVKILLSDDEIDANLSDFDGSTALSIAVENGHKDIGVLIYAHLNSKPKTFV